MQQLPETTTLADGYPDCASALMEVAPPVVWFMRHRMRAHRRGVSLLQFQALVFLKREPHVSLSKVADHLGATLPNVSRLIASLVDKGLVVRSGHPGDRPGMP